MISDKDYLELFLQQLKDNMVLPMATTEGVEENLIRLIEEESQLKMSRLTKEKDSIQDDTVTTLPTILPKPSPTVINDNDRRKSRFTGISANFQERINTVFSVNESH